MRRKRARTAEGGDGLAVRGEGREELLELDVRTPPEDHALVLRVDLDAEEVLDFAFEFIPRPSYVLRSPHPKSRYVPMAHDSLILFETGTWP